jgi:hypothetical protein
MVHKFFKHIYIRLVNGNFINYAILEYQYIFWHVYKETLQNIPNSLVIFVCAYLITEERMANFH